MDKVRFDFPTGLAIVQSDRMEHLRSLCLEYVEQNPLPPFESETLVVQSNGIRQWLRLGFAEHESLGISTDSKFLLTSPFLWACYRSFLDERLVPSASPFDRNVLLWRIYRLLPGLIQRDPIRFDPLRRFLERSPHPIKSYQLSQQIADLFDEYQVHRSDWLLDWGERRDELRFKAEEAATEALPPEQRWQAELWRTLIQSSLIDWKSTSRASLHQTLLDRISAISRGEAERPPNFPKRILIFGISSLPRQALETFGALGQLSQILYFVHNPCQYYWGDLIESRDLLIQESRRFKRKPGPSKSMEPSAMHLDGHPLLASLGKQGRDFLRLLDEWDDLEVSRSVFHNRINVFSEAPQHPTLLERLQQGILNLEAPPPFAEPTQPISKTDTSIRFIEAHSPQREIEILHDTLLDLLDLQEGQPPGLKPSEIIVMLPDVDLYAPAIHAVFGRSGLRAEQGSPRIPYSIADQKQRAHDPLYQAVEVLLKLPESRFAASEILDLLEIPAIQAQFNIRPRDYATLYRWVRDTGIRWGLDTEQREQCLDLAPHEDPVEGSLNTWEFGLRRLFLGYATGGEIPFETTVPYAQIGGSEGNLLGSLYIFLRFLKTTATTLDEARSPSEWMEMLKHLLDQTFTPTTSGEERALEKLRETLEDLLDDLTLADFNEPLPLIVIREAWLSRLDQPALSQRFLSGSVNFCTLMPMRSIPFKVVCLLGMNADAFPRQDAPRSFDLLRSPGLARSGDRARREDDRYMFLEALLSAREKLIVSWIGRDIRDQSKREPSVLVSLLRDTLGKYYHLEGTEDPCKRSENSKALLQNLTRTYPLQPFSGRYFSSEDPSLWTYAQEWADLHMEKAEPSIEAPLAPRDIDQPIRLQALIQFLKMPAQHFFNQRLEVRFKGADALIKDDEPFSLDQLDRYQVLGDVLSSTPPEASALERLRLEGRMPLGAPGVIMTRSLGLTAQTIRALESPLLETFDDPLDSPLELPRLTLTFEGAPPIVIEDWLDALRPSRSAPGHYAAIEYYPSSLFTTPPKRHALIPLWVRQLAANAAGIHLSSYLIGEDGIFSIPELASQDAERSLEALVKAFRLGYTAPLPVAPRTAFAHLSAKNDSSAPTRLAFEGQRKKLGERDRSLYLRRAFPSLSMLLTTQVGGEDFNSLSKSLYKGLLDTARRGLP